jgi:4-amino-4-deoxy-L-arabinose transferase-like glycosyltransferase
MTEQTTAQPSRTERLFRPLLGATVAIAAAVRVVYVLADDRALPAGDGFSYHFEAIRLADGLGYTSAFGDVGQPIAHHPPAWVTLLGIISWLGGRSLRAHQCVAVAFGLGVVLLAGLIGRRYFDARVGLIAALAAALYPGFWLIETNVLSEPLALVLVGALTLLVADLRGRPTLLRSVVVGAICGLLGLTRPEQLALLGIVVVPLLLLAGSLSVRQRILRIAAVAITCGLVIVPWTVYNASRFEEPVLLSTNGGVFLLIGNCSYSGERLGFYDTSCFFRLARQHRGYDRSQMDVLARSVAVDNARDNLDRLPVVVPARIGRMLALFRPGQTVGWVGDWMATGTWLIWAWVVSFWVLLAAAIVGWIVARRRRQFSWPLVAPLVAAVFTVAISCGEPRNHTPADLGVMVLAAVALERLLVRPRRSVPVEADRPQEVGPRAGGTPRRVGRRRDAG